MKLSTLLVIPAILIGQGFIQVEGRSLRPPAEYDNPRDISPFGSLSKSESIHSFPRTWELTFKQDAERRNCTFFSLRQVQHYRDLGSSSTHVIRHKHDLVPDSVFNGGIEVVKVVGSQQDIVKMKAKEVCEGQEFWGNVRIGDGVTEMRDPEQVFLGSTIRSDLPVNSELQVVEAPRLEIEALIESGRSNNRVDLVFFSDGCTSLSPSLYLPLLSDYER